MKRVLVAVAALVMLVVVVPSQAHAGAVGPVSMGGSGTSVGLGEKFSISVKTNAGGKLSGSAKYEYPGLGIRVAGHVTCLYVSGNTATTVIAVESGNSTTGYFRRTVTDNGSVKVGTPDTIYTNFYQLTGSCPPGFFGVVPFASGNVTVKGG